MKQLAKISFQEFYEINETVVKTTPMRKVHYASRNKLERWVWQRKRTIIKELLSGVEYNSLIDVGCGDGGLFELVKRNCDYTGLDISPIQLASFKNWLKKNNIGNNPKLVQADATEIPFDDNTFDVALVCDVLEHVLDPVKAMKEINRVVKKDGNIIISIPNEMLFQLARLLTGRFPLRSPDHLYSIEVGDLKQYFPKIIKHFGIPLNLFSSLNLINIILAQN